MTNDTETASIATLEGAVTNGRHYFPAARYVTLIGLNQDGDSTGAAADICRDCVRTVAEQALAVMRGLSKVPHVGSDLGKPGYLGDGALAECGEEFAYDLAGCNDVNPGDGEESSGDSDPLPCICAECHGDY